MALCAEAYLQEYSTMMTTAAFDDKRFVRLSDAGIPDNVIKMQLKGTTTDRNINIFQVSITVFQDFSGHFNTYSVSQKNPPLGDLTFFHFFHKRLRICKRFFTHLLNVPIVARLQIFIQLSPILTKLCHIKRDCAVHIICAKCPKRAKTRELRRLTHTV